MSDLYRDFIDQKADQIINNLGGTITPAPANAELYRDFLDRKFDDVINAIGNVKVKSFTYTATNSNINTIVFPEIPKVILNMEHSFEVTVSGVLTTRHNSINSFIYGQTFVTSAEWTESAGYNVAPSIRPVQISYNGVEITLRSEISNRSMNRLNETYTVYYI